MNLEIQEYINNRIATLTELKQDVAMFNEVSSIEEAFYHCLSNGGKVYTIGNGGSCAQAQHFAAELIGRFGGFNRRALPAVALTSDSTVMSALSNDFGYEHCFSRQVEALVSTTDILVAFTTSGRSRNIIEAVQSAKNIGATTILFCGCQKYYSKEEVDYCISVASDDTAIIQECHLILSHYLCKNISKCFEERVNIFWNSLIENIPQEADFLILDRDGVINEKIPNRYVKSPLEFKFTPGFLDKINILSQRFKRIFVVTNQKGVGLGLMSLEELKEVHKYMQEQIVHYGGRIDQIYYSTAIDELALDRKPNIGLANKIIADYPDVNLNKTLVIGDSASDQLFAKNIGAMYMKFSNA